jgi:hypothetical protein
MHKSVAFLLVFGDDDDGAGVGWLVVEKRYNCIGDVQIIHTQKYITKDVEWMDWIAWRILLFLWDVVLLYCFYKYVLKLHI